MKENTRMRNHFGKSMLALAMGIAMTSSGQASAQAVVIDPANLAVNHVNAAANTASMIANMENAATNTASTIKLGVIKHHTINIDKTGQGILGTNKQILKTNNEILATAKNIQEMDVRNHTVNKNYTWITNNNYGGDGDPVVIPIPGRADGHMASLDEAALSNRVENFREAAYYQGDSDAGRIDARADVAGSSTQKSANDALVNLLSSQRSNIGGEAEAIRDQAVRATSKPEYGQAEQLQNAAALAGMQANQLVQMRALMIASQNQQAAAAQAVVDRQAREIASAQSLRRSFGATHANGEQQPASVKASW
jgi:hypothetical protein